MKNLSRFLAILLLLQSCNAYHKPTSVEAAVVAEKKTRVISTDNQKYHFNRVEINNDRLIGITTLGSATAKRLAGMPALIDGKNLEIDLSRIDIDKISLRNNSASTLLTVGIVSLVIAQLIFLYYGLNSESAGEQFLRDLNKL